MSKKQKTKIKIKRRIMKIAVLVCVVCFVAVFFISSAHFTTHAQDRAGRENVSANVCQRTLLPECECSTGIPLVQMQNQADSFFHSHNHSEAHIDCLVCILILKTVNPVRYFNAVVTTVMLTDTNVFAFISLCIILALAGLSTPVKLKSRTNN